MLPQPERFAVNHLLTYAITEQVDLQHGEVVGRHLFDKRFLSGVGHLSFGCIDRLADVCERLIQVLRDIELDKKTRHAL